MTLPPAKLPTKAQIEASNTHKQNNVVLQDIRKINSTINKADPEEMKSLHIYLDTKYQYAIADWGKNMYEYNDDTGFNYNTLDANSLKYNLSIMKPKLESFMYGWTAVSKPNIATKAPDVSVTVNNTVNISVSFEETRQKIEDMTALSREQTDEILQKIDELEEISKDNSSRKTKWEKVKPIIAFTLEKGADVAIAILSLVIQMRLGM